MNKILNKYAVLLSLLFFALIVNSNAQNTPTNARHLLSISLGISAPYRMVVKSDGAIYVTDVVQNNIVKYNKSFDLLGSINLDLKPRALAINSSDEIFFSDDASGAIYKLDNNENTTLFSNVINDPSSMVFGSNNLLYVVDTRLKQVTVLDSDGKFVRTIGTGLLIQPTGITYDKKNDRLLISEHGGVKGGSFGTPVAKIWIFDTNGTKLGEFGSGGFGDGKFMKIQGLAISRTGTIYVVDPTLASISIFEENKVYLSRFGEYGTNLGELNIPMDVVFDSQGRILVTSMNTGAIEVYYVNEINPTYKITAVNKILCPGQNTNIQVNFTGTAPWDFTYTKDGSNPITIIDTYDNPYIFNVSEAGLYEVTALSDAMFNAVDFSSSLIVTQNPFPTSTITSSDVEICYGTNTDVLLNLTGVAPFTFTYTDGISPVTINNYESNSYNITASISGTYEVTYIKDGGGCVGTELTGIANVNVNSLPSSLITSSDTIICEGETYDISISFTGVAPWTFTYAIDGIEQSSITTSDNPYLLNIGIEGAYSIRSLSDASNEGNCFTGSANVIVTPLPTSNIVSDDVTICNGESTDIVIELTGIAPWDLTYTVNGINPVTINGISESPFILSAQDSGLYEVIELSSMSCSGNVLSGTSQITVAPFPSSYITSGDSIFTICNNEPIDFTVELTGTSPWTFKYIIDDSSPITISTDSSSYKLKSSSAGVYEIIEIVDLHCKSTNSKGFPIIKFGELPLVNLGQDVVVCEGETVILDASSFASYFWNDGSTTQTIDVNTSGAYSVNVTDANGCQNTDEVIVTVNALPISEFTYTENELEVTFINTSVNADSFVWDFGDNHTSIEENPAYVYSSSGTYYVVLTASSINCGESTISKTISFVSTEINNIELEDIINIYPNPSNGVVTFELNNPDMKRVNVSIINSSGSRVYSAEFEFINNKHQINLNNLPSGFYTVIFYTHDREISKYIIIAK